MHSPPNQDVERRRDPRARASFPLVLTPAAGPVAADVRDVSRSGVCAFLPQPLPEMTRVRFSFELPSHEGPHRVEGEGAVVRCAKAEAGRYEVAVFFTALSDADRERIAGFVRASHRV